VAQTQQFRGVFTIPVTPFRPNGDIDEESLRREVDWCVRAGAHGIVAPVNASEGPTLTDDERVRVTRIVTETTAGRIPVVIGVSGVGAQSSLLYARAAREAGANAVIAMPPYGVRLPDFGSIVDFYQRLADAAGLPVFVQNWSGPAGTPLTAQQVAQLLREIDHVSYVKEETASASHLMTGILAEAGDACLGVMGGIGGRYLLDEYRRGSCGTMPACQSTDIHAAIWNRLDGGDEDGARQLFYRLLPLLNMEAAFGAALYKEILRRRGVIAHANTRTHRGSALDAYDQQELDALMKGISDLFVL
jgi:dihydrodipicolinate synthase/N-acetylneuraminate lyase